MLFFIYFRKYMHLLRKETLGRLMILMICIIVLGAAGMVVFEKGRNSSVDSVGDALWWTFVTVTTVGYGDIFPQTLGGRIIGVIIMIFGIGFLGMLTATIASTFVERKIKEDRGLRAYKDMKDHVLLCGWNYSAAEIVSEIHADYPEKDIIIIANLDSNPLEENHVHFIAGDPADLKKLEMACFKTASTVIVLYDESKKGNGGDGQSILTVLAIKYEQPDLYVCVQILDENNMEHCIRAGANEVVVTGGLTAKLLGQAAINHGITRVVSELLSNKYGNDFYKVKCPSKYVGSAFKTVFYEVKDKHNAIVVALEKGQQFLTNPKNDVIMDKDDYLIIIAEEMPRIAG